MVKKVLFIMPTLEGGGAEKVLSDVLKYFDYSKYEVSLLLIRRTGIYLDSIPSPVKIYFLDDFTVKPIRYVVNRYTYRLWEKYKLGKVLGKSRYDTIVSFMEGEALYYHSMITDRAERNVSWVHIDLFKNHWTGGFFKSLRDEIKAYHKMDEIVCVSKQARINFLKLFGNDFRSTVIYNIIDKGNIVKKGSEQLNLDKGAQFTLCNVGRLSPQKRQDRLIEAVAILTHRYRLDVEVWILGTGGLEQQLRELAEKLGVAERVRFIGFRPNPYPYIKKSDVFVLSSDTEGYPLVVAEAICLGKPIVSTRITGPVEMLDGDVGVLTDLSADSLAFAINSLLTESGKAAEYSRKSLERSSIYEPTETMDEIYSVL